MEKQCGPTARYRAEGRLMHWWSHPHHRGVHPTPRDMLCGTVVNEIERETDALMEPPPPPRGPPYAERHALWHGRERTWNRLTRQALAIRLQYLEIGEADQRVVELQRHGRSPRTYKKTIGFRCNRSRAIGVWWTVVTVRWYWHYLYPYYFCHHSKISVAPVVEQVILVPTKINFAASILTECTYS